LLQDQDRRCAAASWSQHTTPWPAASRVGGPARRHASPPMAADLLLHRQARPGASPAGGNRILKANGTLFGNTFN
jgi:hypothetical protein